MRLHRLRIATFPRVFTRKRFYLWGFRSRQGISIYDNVVATLFDFSNRFSHENLVNLTKNRYKTLVANFWFDTFVPEIIIIIIIKLYKLSPGTMQSHTPYMSYVWSIALARSAKGRNKLNTHVISCLQTNGSVSSRPYIAIFWPFQRS